MMTAGTFYIRRAKDGDAEIIRQLLEAEWRHNGYSDEEIENLKSTSYDPGAAASRIEAEAHNPHTATGCWLALCEGKAVGFTTTADISGGVFVDHDYRGMGIAAELIKHKNDFEAGRGMKTVEALILANNAASLRLHAKLGYDFNEKSRMLIDAAAAQGIQPADMTDERGRPVLLQMTKTL